jgi:hypothetical protein
MSSLETQRDSHISAESMARRNRSINTSTRGMSIPLVDMMRRWYVNPELAFIRYLLRMKDGMANFLRSGLSHQ